MLFQVCDSCFPVDTPKNIVRRVSVLPMNSLWIMRQIPVDIPCHYVVPLNFNVSNVVMEQTDRVALRLGILGTPGLQEWQINYTCQQESLFHSEKVEVCIIVLITIHVIVFNY